jgi:2-polyprenyl-6-methoxyphenol hydroxylase-like FAD-dependent oxidoreductase
MRRLGERAVVLGASMSGLLSARVLTEAFDQVTIVERDELPQEPAHRRGVPQSRHVHGVLARGREALEELLPGLTGDLVRRGALLGDGQDDVRWVNERHRLRQQPSQLQGIAVSRPLLEAEVRSRVLALPNVEATYPAEAQGLDARQGRVTGVRIRRSDRGADEETLIADLIIDATGRRSRSPEWLEALGYPAPAESRIEVDLGYASCVFPRHAGDLAGDLGAIIGATPAVPRMGAALAAERDRWIVTLGGYTGEHPPSALGPFREFAATLAAPDIADLIADKEPLEEARRFRFANSLRRHYERLRRFPRGYLVVGDAVCSFNPIYGQGMSVAAIEALSLRDCLAEGEARLARRFYQRSASSISTPWDIAAGGDLRLPAVPGPRPVRVQLVNAYVARVQAAAASDSVVGHAFLRVVNLLAPPTSLLRPPIAARVLIPHPRPVDHPTPAKSSTPPSH